MSENNINPEQLAGTSAREGAAPPVPAKADQEHAALATAPDASGASHENVKSSGASGELVPRSEELRVSADLSLDVTLVRASTGQSFLVLPEQRNAQCAQLGSRAANQIIRALAYRKGVTLTRRDIVDINDALTALAHFKGIASDVWSRVAPIEGGIELDLGDDAMTRVRVTAQGVQMLNSGSTTLFYRPPIAKPMVLPAETGDLKHLDRYLNVNAADAVLLRAWISYSLAHAKQLTTKFPILILQGEQGTGKTFLCNLIFQLVDPNSVGVQILPTNGKDLAIAAQNSHVLAYDNVRGFKQSMADLLCIASTGGALSSRQLYTDAEQAIQRLHVALVLNGIHDFVTQPDLAQRCLPIQLKPIRPDNRRSEGEILREFERDLPVIFRGLLDLVALIFAHLPAAEPAHPQRLIDFSRWLAAMEAAEGIQGTPYQDAYDAALLNVQRDALLESPIAIAVMAFAEKLKTRQWSGTPTAFLEELNTVADPGAEFSKSWPKGPIALSKGLKPLLGGLREQGIDIQMTRSKERQITLTIIEGFQHG